MKYCNGGIDVVAHRLNHDVHSLSVNISRENINARTDTGQMIFLFRDDTYGWIPVIGNVKFEDFLVYLDQPLYSKIKLIYKLFNKIITMNKSVDSIQIYIIK